MAGGELNKWVHIATAYSAKEKNIRFYINGELDVENNWGGGSPGVFDPAKLVHGAVVGTGKVFSTNLLSSKPR